MRLLLFIALLANSIFADAQLSDIISVKKNGRTVKSFYAGSRIQLQTKSGNYFEGPIKEIKKDTVFLTIYDIRTVPTQFGVTIVDTVAIYTTGVYYKDIADIKVFNHYKTNNGLSSHLLMYGGGGYIVLNLINSAYLHQSVTSKKNVRNLGISLGVFTAGFLLNKFSSAKRRGNKNIEIEYIKLR